MEGLKQNDSSICPKIPIAESRLDSTVDAYMNSPGKRKFEDMNSQNYSNSVRELIGNFEVGTPTKRQKTGRSSRYVDNQLHSSLEFGSGKTKKK